MRRPAILAIGAALALTGVLVASGPAFADGQSTTTTFAEPSAVSAPFGSPWVLTITVAPNEFPVIPDASSGTVDVYVEGIAGAYASNLPLARGGIAFFAQPTAQPALAAGVHQITAIFNPAAGSGLVTSQTTVPATLTIEPLIVTASAVVVDDPAVVTVPTLVLSLDGSYIEQFGGPPPGEWKVTALDDKTTPVFDATVVQPTDSADPIDVPLDSGFKAGKKYTIEVVFTPDPSVAQGITLTNPDAISYQTADAAPLAWLVAPVAIGTTGVLIIGILLLLLLAAATTLAVLYFRKRSRVAAGNDTVRAERRDDGIVQEEEAQD